MKIDIKEIGEAISVSVCVEPLKGKSRVCQKRKISRKDVLDHLATQNIKVGPCIKNPPLVTNKMSPEQLCGEWIFEKVRPPSIKKVALTIKKASPVKKKGPQARKKPKKVEKILDKSPEDVIIEVEKKETLTLSKTKTVTEE